MGNRQSSPTQNITNNATQPPTKSWWQRFKDWMSDSLRGLIKFVIGVVVVIVAILVPPAMVFVGMALTVANGIIDEAFPSRTEARTERLRGEAADHASIERITALQAQQEQQDQAQLRTAQMELTLAQQIAAQSQAIAALSQSGPELVSQRNILRQQLNALIERQTAPTPTIASATPG